MVKKLTRHDDEMCLVIEKTVLETLEIALDTELVIAVEDHSLVITPVGRKRRSRPDFPVVPPIRRPPGEPGRSPAPSKGRYGFPKKQPW
jgi:hypothetical protein